MKEKNLKRVKTNPTSSKGITLVALVITIIVMLILVAVTINMAITGGLFEYANKAKEEMKNAMGEEGNLGSEGINVGDKNYDTIEDYLEGRVAISSLPTYEEAAKTEGYLTENAKYIENEYTAIIPKGYQILEVNGEKSIAKGLVIKDSNNNEFVWIPVDGNLVNPYTSSTNYSEPTVLEDTYSESNAKYDSQATLNKLYGANYFNYETDFKYVEEYEKMVASVNKYHGFYVGRYETTIDASGNIGCVNDTPVLTANKPVAIKGTTAKTCRWYGLYYVSKTTNYIVENGSTVQSAMIYGQLWDKTMNFIKAQRTAGNTEGTYDVAVAHSDWHTGTAVVNSGKANAEDVALNIYDLESNARDWSQEAYYASGRAHHGGDYGASGSASISSSGNPTSGHGACASRLALYIK